MTDVVTFCRMLFSAAMKACGFASMDMLVHRRDLVEKIRVQPCRPA